MPDITAPATERVLHRALAPLDASVTRSGEPGNDTLTLSGYAAVTDVATTLYEGRAWVWREKIAPGAFTNVLDRIRSGDATYPVVLNHEHDNRASVASTNRAASDPGGLELSEDDRGLRVFARLDAADPDVQRLTTKMRNDVTRQMSFAFTISEFETLVTEDDQGRQVETDTIIEVRDLYDVTVCAHGAYPQTTADLRSLLAATGRSTSLVEGHTTPDRAQAGPGETDPVAPPGVGGGDPARHKRLAVIRLELMRAAATHKPKEG